MSQFAMRYAVLLCIAACSLPLTAGDFAGGLFGNLTATYAGFIDGLYAHLAADNATDACRKDSQRLEALALLGDENALKMLDATGKPSSGLLQGGVSFIGFYSECVRTSIDGAHGKYCLLSINLNGSEIFPHVSWLVLSEKSRHPAVGICVPESCTDSDVATAAETSGSLNLESDSVSVSVCHTDVTGFSQDVGAILTLIVFVLFSAIAIAATACEWWRERVPSPKPPGTEEEATNSSMQELCEPGPRDPPGTLLQCLLSFSLLNNARKMFTVSKAGGEVQCIHGLKFLSMALILFGHTFSFATTNLFLRNPGFAQQAPQDFFSQIFANGTFAVDTFYVISGLLVSYVSLKTMAKLNGKLPLLYFYIHRYFRLTPLLGAVIMFCAFLLRYVGSGPNWLATIEMYDLWCKENGWINMLYLHNFIHTEHMCLSHSWYLATDMQMFLVTPLILIPLFRSVKYGATAAGGFLLASVLTTAIITAVNNYPAIPYINGIMPLTVVNEYYKNVYIKPYCRIGPYIIGMAVGCYLLHKNILLRKHTVIALWCSFVALCLAVIYLMWPANQGILPTTAEAAAYSSLARNVWALCMAWLIVACNAGYGGLLNTFLSARILVPLSRLTYCAYLIHPVVMNAYYGSIQEMVDFSSSFIVYAFLGNLCITYILSIILSLLFESPFLGLEKVLTSSKIQSTQEKK